MIVLMELRVVLKLMGLWGCYHVEEMYINVRQGLLQSGTLAMRTAKGGKLCLQSELIKLDRELAGFTSSCS